MICVVKDCVGVRTSVPKGVDGRPADALSRSEHGLDRELEVPLGGNRGINLLEPDVGWYNAVLQHQHRLDQAGDAACTLQVTYVRLDGSDNQRLRRRPLVLEDGSDGTRLKRVADGRASTVSFEEAGCLQIQPGARIR